jgi:hypothetical protein
MISIDKSVLKLLNDAPNPSVYKIFLFIVLNQPDEGIYGFHFTKDDLIAHLNSSKTSIFRDLKWLKDNLLVQELKLAEDFDFMANPRFVMNNSDYNERFAEWNRRCNLDSAREVRLRKERRLRKLRNAKKSNQ